MFTNSPYYPLSSGKIEGYHHTIKCDGIRPLSPLCLEDAQRGVGKIRVRIKQGSPADRYQLCGATGDARRRTAGDL